MSVRDFFDKYSSFKLKAESIIKANDLKLLQGFIGVKNSVAFLQYNASFYLTKTNIRQAEYHAKVAAPIQIKKYICSEIEKNGKIPINVTAEVENAVSSTKQNLTDRKLLMPNFNCEHKFLLDSKSTDIKMYVEETNIGNLCTLSKELAINVYDKLVGKNELEKTVEHISKKKPAEVKQELKKEIEKLDRKEKIFFEEFEDYNKHLQEIKDGTFLSEWYNELICDIVKEALNNKSHLLHDYVKCYKSDNNDNSKFIAKVLMSDIRTTWNKELLTRISTKSNVNISRIGEKKLLEYIDVKSQNFAKHLLEKFEEMKSEVLENSVKQLVTSFTPSLLEEEEQNLLNYLLQIAVQHKKKDMVLLLIFNGANYKAIKNIDACINVGELAFLEVKRLYKNMPSIELPKFTSKQIRDIYPLEDMNKIADLIIHQEETLFNKRELLEEMLKVEFPWYLFLLYLKNISTKINLNRIEKANFVVKELKNAFEEDTATSSPEPFYKDMKNIKKEEGWFSLNTKMFKELEKLAESTANINKAISVKDFIENITASKTEYMKGKHSKEIIYKEPNITKTLAEELELRKENQSKEKQNLIKLHTVLKAEEEIIEKDEKKVRSDILKAKFREKRAKEDEIRIKEGREAKLRMADARVVATILLHDEAEKHNINVSTNEEVKEFLLQLFSFKVINDNYISEFNDVLNQFQAMKDCASSEGHSLNKFIELETKFNKLCTRLVELGNEESDLITKIPLCSDPSLSTFISVVLTKMKYAKKTLQAAKEKAQAEKDGVEKQL